jgi:hypothetical protein
MAGGIIPEAQDAPLHFPISLWWTVQVTCLDIPISDDSPNYVKSMPEIVIWDYHWV